jgi:hypothetical protein
MPVNAIPPKPSAEHHPTIRKSRLRGVFTAGPTFDFHAVKAASNYLGKLNVTGKIKSDAILL